ncbi:MAG TPA: VCBS repeat-containing protein [Candidatus Hydrogenedentes bacterium]|nr:VCBS repeat-containing protein [Candidatus Hydrogenedentota bacterium]HOS03903.1 VCBS repeat-containing protein [Candidatus Hydrogenedentota bacterium]
MMAGLMLAMLLAARDMFRVDVYPLPDPDAYVFLARADADLVGDVAILNGTAMTVHASGSRGTPLTVQLEPGTSAVDVADVDGDKRAEVVAICGDRILTYVLSPGSPSPQPTEALTRPSLLSAACQRPFPRVLVVYRGGRPLLALPQKDFLELVSLDGTVDSRYGVAFESPTFASDFWAYDSRPPLAGSASSLEWRIGARHCGGYDLPVDLKPGPVSFAWEPFPNAWRRDEGKTLPHSRWPTFPLRVMGEDARQVRYQSPAPPGQETVIRIVEQEKRPQPEGSDIPPGDEFVAGPEHRYPGIMVTPDGDLPDYNHDGYVDLTLWQAPDPGLSVNALTRAISIGTWPLRIAVYLYSPEKKRFDIETVKRIDTEAPVFLFMGGEPVQHCVLRDLNGDGYADCGFRTADKKFSIWLYNDGFADKPDAVTVFPEPIKQVAFRADLNGDGSTNVGFRGEKAMYVLGLAQSGDGKTGTVPVP